MHKQLKQMMVWLSRKRVLLFVLFFSIMFLGSAMYRFAWQNKWLEEEFTKQVKSNDLNNQFAKLSFYIKNAESADRGYVISGDPKFVLNFSATIDSIRATYLQIKQFENRENEIVKAAMYLKADSFIEHKIAFMQLVKSLCDDNDCKAAAALIATNKGVNLSDSITGITTRITESLQAQLKNSQREFLNIRSRNNNLAYSGILVSMLFIALVFCLLLAEIRRTKNISAELFVRKENYRTTLNSLAEGLITTDNIGQVVYMNPAAEQLTGWSWREAKARPLQEIYDVVNEETGRPFENIVSRIIKQGKIIELENNTILKAKNTGRFIISNTAAPLLDSNGNISGAVLVFNNITEKKEIERQLKNSEEKYRNLIEEASDAILIYSFDGTIHEFNKTCYTILGYTKEEYTKLKLTDILVDDIIVNQENYAAILAGETKTLYRHLVRKDGSLMETEVTVKMLADGKAIAFARDITERKKAEAAIRQNEKKFRALVENNDGIIVLTDENFKTFYRSPSAERITGRTNDELAGMGIENVTHPDDTKKLKELWNDLIANPKKLLPASLRFLHKNGSYIFLEGTAVNLLDDENVKAIVINVLDVTQRKKAEAKTKSAIERYDILADATSDTIWDWDIVNNKMLYNDGITKMFGYKGSDVENVVDWWNEKLHPEDFNKVTELLADVFENGLQNFQSTYRFRCADDSFKYIFDRAFVIFDDSGKPTRMIGAMQDITNEIEEEIRTAKAIIDAQEKERRYIGAELHDNVNQILAGSLLILGMVKKDQVDTERSFEFIETGKGHIVNAIQEVRKLSHSLSPASFDDNSLKGSLDDLLLTLNLNNDFAIQFDFEDICNKVNDEIQINLYRILQEQTKNILTYAGASTIEIAVKLIDNVVLLRIYDNGKGFDTKSKKSGIGLSNIKKRAESLSGKFILNSAPGKGCEIIVEIPLKCNE